MRTGPRSFEAFDEWEELALFASHYFLLIASNNPEVEKVSVEVSNETNEQDVTSVPADFVLPPHCPSGRFTRPGDTVFWFQMARVRLATMAVKVNKTRLSSTDLYFCSGGCRSDAGLHECVTPSRH